MSASSLVINLGEDSFNMEDQSEIPPNDSKNMTTNSTPDKTSPPETPQDDDVDLPQCKIKRNYACSHCSYYTQNPRFYLYHLKNVHKEKIRIYECPSCLYASKHSQKLQRHVHMVHVMCTGKRKVQPKPKPPPKLPKPPPPTKIIRSVPKEGEEEDDEEESFVGGMIASDGENRSYKCSLCPFTSRSQTLVTRHERIVHLKKKFFRCIKCNYMTHMKARFTKHVKYHSMPMIKCEMCDFRTPYKWNLDRHNKNHFGDGAFKCSQCNFTADIKQSLTVHEMNHHVPPVGQATPTKRRNRVGASDTVSALEDETIDQEELELLRLEREDDLSDGDIQQVQMKDPGIESLNHLDELEVTTKPLPPSSRPKKVMVKKPKTVAHFNTKELTVKLGEKVVNPGDVLQHKNGAVYVKKIKCRMCNYRAAWESEMSRHELRVHGLGEKKKIPARPIPNLIPIQNKSPSQPPPPPAPLPIPPPPLKSPQQKPLPTQMHNVVQIQSHPPPLKIHPRPPSQILLPTSQPLLIQTTPHQIILQPQPLPQLHQPIPPHPMMLQSHQHQTQPQFHQTPPPPPLRPSPMQQPLSHQSQAPILKIPTPVKGKSPSSASTPERAMSEKDLNDICAKSCPNSSLKDFASLIGGDDAFKTSDENIAFSVGSGTSAFPIEKKENKAESIESSEEIKKTPEAFKKKNASFFDKLKEKLMTGAGESCNLVCDVCGHESKCLSESVRHQKMHNTKISGSASCNGGTVISGTELSSTRCQHCRQRCKTSSDLVVHLQSCMEANKKSPVHVIDDDEEEEEEDEDRMDYDDELKSEEGLSDGEMEKPPHPMENKVFVWNNMSNCEEDGLNDEDDSGSKSPTSESSVVGIETAPGIGAVTSKSKYTSQSNSNGQNLQQSKSESVKKVYKCPHCSFWASTASRFHVHIVGHLNKKPFECSLCSYRSNWRWDITKHIRLKTVRDSTHERARVLMTDETGRRNYSKYNKYLTLMRVHEPSAESSGSGKRTKPITQSYDPIETLPAPPKLTPAPLSALQANNSSNIHIMMNNSTPPPPPPLSQRPMYAKPPPLQSSLDMKRAAAQESDMEPPKKKQNIENKKTMWKCKKCLFRDSDRTVVLAHVKEHYRGQIKTVSNEESRGASLNELTDEDQERHCRLKHKGDVKIIVGQSRQGFNAEENALQDNEVMNDEENDQGNGFMCETCPFVCSNQKELDEHMECHFERPGATLKCYYCPFYVRDKMELLDHLSLHGDSDGDEVCNTNPTIPTHQGKINMENGESSFNSKRYRCSICPYVSNSKSQFLYHKQFHRPRNAPFKCTMCSYNVTRRHLLHQHLRLHGINILIPKTKDSGLNEFEEADLVGTMNELDTSKMSEIPLVWVSKMGNLTKMFKCRFCPHVNIRKSNIQEHEKMHGVRVKNNPDGSSPQPQQQHHCPDCNYICNNAGVLSSHAKVHQGLFGQVCSLVDMNRPDDVQIKELNTILGRHEEGPPEILPDEINKDFKEHFPVSVDKDTDQPIIDGKVLHFCSTCPARFLYPKELEIHTRFHNLQLQFRCEHCTYTARQQPHLLAHYKVHTDEYQDRTSSLCEVYRISNQNPKPKIAVVVDGSESAGNAWVVVPVQKMIHTNSHTNEYELDETFNDISLHGSRVIHKQFACDKCPAKFFKTVALQYHMTLHGGPGPHKCRVCDYSVKTYGNLIKHEAVHEELEPRAKMKAKAKRPSDNVPTSGTELFRQKTEAAQKCAANTQLPPPPPPPLHIDPEFGILMHGSPEFIYPTYLKNGRLKEKRYKCHKCPSAFEKREQYKVHLSLHGSKQRYKCERCDYSVKYYANYIQHLRKHQSNDATKAERTLSSDGKIDDSGNEGITETHDNNIQQSEDVTNIMISRSAKKMQLSMADQQTMMLMQQRVVSNSVSAPEVLNRCPHCPYSNQRKDGVGSHAKCHSNIKGGAFTCKHCDYTVPQQHFLREHNKLHFSPMKGTRPEAFMKCDRLELWAEPIEQADEPLNKILIFKDKGSNFKVKRFLPEVLEEVNGNDSEVKEKTYINLKTGELENGQDSPGSPEKDDDKENKKSVCNGSVGEEGATDETLQEENGVNNKDEAEEKIEESFSDNEADKNDEIKSTTDFESNQESEDKIITNEDKSEGDDKSLNYDDKSLISDDKSMSSDEKSMNFEDKNDSGEDNKETGNKSESEHNVNSTSSDSDSEDSSSDSSSSDESDGDSSSSSITSTQQD